MTDQKSNISFLPFPKSNRFINRTGQRYGRMVALGIKSIIRKTIHWWCECDCGQLVSVSSSNLATGHVQSCGCLRQDANRARLTTHGESRKGLHSTEYRSFAGAQNRCQNTNNPAFSRYGGRGIEFRFGSFQEFLECLGRKPSAQHSLDRIDNDGHYEPGNVRWATDVEQRRNRRDCQFLTFDGKSLMVKDWAKEYDISASVLTRRLQAGWCISCTLTQPLQKDHSCHKICTHR